MPGHIGDVAVERISARDRRRGGCHGGIEAHRRTAAGPGGVVEGGQGPGLAERFVGGHEPARGRTRVEELVNHGAGGFRFGEIRASGRAADSRARPPVRGRTAGAELVALGEGSAGAVRRHGPRLTVPVAQFVHKPAIVVPQAQGVTGVGKMPGERAEYVRHTAGGLKRGWIGSHDEIIAGSQDGISRKTKLNASLDAPVRQFDVNGHLVVQLHPFQRRIVGGRVIHDLVECNNGIRSRGRVGWVKECVRPRERSLA